MHSIMHHILIKEAEMMPTWIVRNRCIKASIVWLIFDLKHLPQAVGPQKVGST